MLAHPLDVSTRRNAPPNKRFRRRALKVLSMSLMLPAFLLPRGCGQPDLSTAGYTPKVQTVTSTSVSVTWPTSRGATSYQVGVVDSVSGVEHITKTYSASAVLTSLPEGSKVTIRVRAVARRNVMRWSRSVSVQLAAPTTAAPTTAPPTTAAPVITTAPPTTAAPVVTTAPPTTAPPTTAAPTTAPPTTAAPTTAPPTTAAPTTAPPTTSAPASGQFPTAATAGVPAGTTLVPWPGSLRTSQVTPTSTTTRNGMSCKVFDRFDIAITSATTMYIDSPCVVFTRTRFSTTADWFTIIQASSDMQYLEVSDSDFDGGPYHVRGILADYGSVTVLRSEFTRFGNAGVEVTDRSATRTMTVTDSYFYEPGGWPRDQHVDGIQMNAGGSAIIRNNTIIVNPYGATVGDTSYVSTSAIGIGTALGSIGSVTIDHNLLAGGGFVIYVQNKSYTWTGTTTITGNVFDRRYGSESGIWGPLYPSQLPPGLVWSDNYWDSVSECSLFDALH